MNERARAVTIATWALDRPNADPDDDLATLSRQFLRCIDRAALAQLTPDTAASSGIRADLDTTEVGLDFFEEAIAALIGEDHGDGAIAAYQRRWEAAKAALNRLRAALAQPTPEPSLRERIEGLRAHAQRQGTWGIEYGDDRFLADVLAIVGVREAPCSECGSDWHYTDEHATPEPALRDALAAALHKAGVGCMEPFAATRDVCVPTDPRYEDFHPAAADAIIAALPGLSLSAQPTVHDHGGQPCDPTIDTDDVTDAGVERWYRAFEAVSGQEARTIEGKRALHDEFWDRLSAQPSEPWRCDWVPDELNPEGPCPYCEGEMCARFDGLGCTHTREERHGYTAQPSEPESLSSSDKPSEPGETEP